ncbi:MAG: cobamide remodeling phosphodiesterase CbiR [Pseudomonadota bacterium]
MRIFKKRFPWNIGATSYVLPATIEENVAFLAGKVDDIQLLFFESPCARRGENPFNKDVLKKLAGENDAGFTVHLPTDIRPGSSRLRQRRNGVEIIAGLMNELDSLNPRCYDLHLPLEDGLSQREWIDNLDDFLSMLKKEIGLLSRLVGIENINYPFSRVRPLVESHGFGICLDVGHALFFADDLSSLMADLSRTRHVHYHGIRNGKDHQSLLATEQSVTAQIGTALLAGGFAGVVTIEVYSIQDLHDSLEHLESVWSRYARDRERRS